MFGPPSFRLHGKRLLRLAQDGDAEASRAFVKYLAERVKALPDDLIELDLTERQQLAQALERLAGFDSNPKRSVRYTAANVFIPNGRYGKKGKQKHASRALAELVYDAVNAALTAAEPGISIGTPSGPLDPYVISHDYIRAAISNAMPALVLASERANSDFAQPFTDKERPKKSRHHPSEEGAIDAAINFVAARLQYCVEGRLPHAGALPKVSYRKRVSRRYNEVADVRNFHSLIRKIARGRTGAKKIKARRSEQDNGAQKQGGKRRDAGA